MSDIKISKENTLLLIKVLAHYKTLTQGLHHQLEVQVPRSVFTHHDPDIQSILEEALVSEETDEDEVDELTGADQRSFCSDHCCGDEKAEDESYEEEEEDVEDIVIHRHMVSSDDLIDLPTITMMVSSSDTLDLSEKKGLQFFVEDGEINVEFGSTTLYDITVVERTAKELTVFSEDTRSNHTFSTTKFPKRWTSLLACNKPYSVRFNTEEGSEW